MQQTTPELHAAPQKLSKIETLRLARNYISALTQTLSEGQPMDLERFLQNLTRGLSQATSNLLAMSFGLNIGIHSSEYSNLEWPNFGSQVYPDLYRSYNTKNNFYQSSDSDSNISNSPNSNINTNNVNDNSGTSCMYFWNNNYLVNENSYKYYETIPKYSQISSGDFKSVHSRW